MTALLKILFITALTVLLVTPDTPSRVELVGTNSDTEYALDALAVGYIKDRKIRERAAKTFWCGTPVMQYLDENEPPAEDFLMTRAEKLEARYRDFVW